MRQIPSKKFPGSTLNTDSNQVMVLAENDLTQAEEGH